MRRENPMRVHARSLLRIGLAATAFLLPGATALAQATPTPTPTVPPDRLNGEFLFVDDAFEDADPLNLTIFLLDGEDFDLEGGVLSCVSGDDPCVGIFFEAAFPNKCSADSRKAAISQKTQTRIKIEVEDLDYEGEASPPKCKVQGKMKGEKGAFGEPDSGLSAVVKVGCKLGENLALVSPAPPDEVLAAIFSAFTDRADVKLSARNGQLKITHKSGKATPTPATPTPTATATPTATPTAAP
jgi:hypothetical protein